MKKIFFMCAITFIFIAFMFVFKLNNSYAAELPDGHIDTKHREVRLEFEVDGKTVVDTVIVNNVKAGPYTISGELTNKNGDVIAVASKDVIADEDIFVSEGNHAKLLPFWLFY